MKTCPIMSRPTACSWKDESPNVFVPINNDRECLKDGCALWVTVCTTGGNYHQCCAFEMMALKDSNGRYVF